MGDVSVFAPGVEGFDVVVELVAFGAGFDAVGEIVVDLFLVESDEIDPIFFEVDEFSDAILDSGFGVVVESGEHESFEVFPGIGIHGHSFQILTDLEGNMDL